MELFIDLFTESTSVCRIDRAQASPRRQWAPGCAPSSRRVGCEPEKSQSSLARRRRLSRGGRPGASNRSLATWHGYLRSIGSRPSLLSSLSHERPACGFSRVIRSLVAIAPPIGSEKIGQRMCWP